MRPLAKLTQKRRDWKWSNAQDNAYNELRTGLAKRPVLVLYDPEARAEVHVNVCMHGLAGILLQQYTNGKLHPVCYFSRQTTVPERKYQSYKLETLAVVESFKEVPSIFSRQRLHCGDRL